MPETIIAQEETKRENRSPTKKRAAPSQASEMATGNNAAESVAEDDESFWSHTITEELSSEHQNSSDA